MRRTNPLVNNKAVLFRRASPEDAVPLLEFAARTYYETFAPLNTPRNMQAYMTAAFNPTQFKKEFADPQATFLVAEIDSTLAGYAKLLEDEAPECVTGDGPIELVRFYVDAQWQGSGLASALMEECLDVAKQKGFKTVYLGVWENNERAKAFYRKWQFERVGQHIFYMGDDPQVDWWMMRRI
jgi:ribosomal protein S18 acetylase RimI-like enzyme